MPAQYDQVRQQPNVRIRDHHIPGSEYGATTTKVIDGEYIDQIIKDFIEGGYEHIVIVRNHADADSVLSEMSIRGLFPAELVEIVRKASEYCDYVYYEGLEQGDVGPRNISRALYGDNVNDRTYDEILETVINPKIDEEKERIIEKQQKELIDSKDAVRIKGETAVVIM